MGTNILSGYLKEEYILENPRADIMIILKWIFKKLHEIIWIGYIWHRIGSNEPCSIAEGTLGS
jgi:hypothetical protein